ncbi:MAG: tripartite tricarboxylate transporter substrate binding protein [Burkholderiales bacterium]|nr:tripartite tricarboxylate transporter substrate binding protein [Burkholderiales bacterium]
MNAPHFAGLSRLASLSCFVCAMFAAAMPEASAQQFPQRPVRLIVPLAPGGGVDITARTVAPRLSTLWGQSVVVDNRPGGTGAIGLETAARAQPDGHTIVLITGTHTARRATHYGRLSYDLLKDFRAVTQMTRQSYVLVLHPAVPAKSIPDLLALAKAKPGSLAYGSAGQGSLQHLSGALLGTLTNTELLHVAYKGGGPALADVLGGQISMVFATPLESVPHIKTGRLRALAVTSPKRSPAMPELPAIAETGVAGYEVTNWYGVLAPVATPAAVVDILNRGIVDVLRTPEMQERFRGDGVELVGSTPAEYQKHISAEIVKWEGVVKRAGIQVD